MLRERSLVSTVWAKLCLSAAVLFTATPSLIYADVKTPAIFGSHMVLQQGQKNRVWGWAGEAEEITVTIADQTHSTKAGEQGYWQVELNPLSVGEALTLTIKGKNTLTYEDVLVGEVWICSGQSNMAWNVNQANDADLEKQTANYPKIRLISVPQVGTQEPQSDFKGQWSVCSPETVGDFSAVGYFYGRQLHQTLNVPIGLIDNAWGGSACEAWIRKDILAADAKYKPLLESWDQRAADMPNALEKYKEVLAKWKEDVEKAKAAGKEPPRRPASPDAVLSGNHRPANIYNGVLKPTIGYGIRGAIWYQGESNASRAYQYRDLFPLMIQSWREEWKQGDFPFYWVQLADFKDEKAEPGESDWAELREAQTWTMSKLKNTGEAVIIDLGEGKDIHPRNKQDVAKRLVRWALADVYGQSKLAHQSPLYKSIEVKENKILVTFDHAGGGLQPFDTREPVGFAIAGEDKKFVWAKARVVGANQIEVWSDSVMAPVAVRYGWADNPVCNVYSKEGLPLTPFRSDDWAGLTVNNVK